MRTAFIQQLVEEACRDERVFLIVGDLGYNVVEAFSNRFPNRFLNAGIAEQNMIGVAAGLASEGYIVYIYSIGNFPTLRCVEQIRNDVAYYNANVRIVAVGAGYAYGSLGMSHHATEEIGIMRSIPNMEVTSPSDPSEARAIATLSVAHQGPMYIRLGKAGEKPIFPSDAPALEWHRMHCLRESDSPNLLLATGSILHSAVAYVESHDINTAIYSMPFMTLDSHQLQRLAEAHPNIIVLEEHQLNCGAGSAVVEALSDLYAAGRLDRFPRVRRLAVPNRFTAISGSQNYLRQLNGLELTPELFV